MKKIIDKAKLPTGYIKTLSERHGMSKQYWSNLLNGHLPNSKNKLILEKRAQHLKYVFELQEEFQRDLKILELMNEIKVKPTEQSQDIDELLASHYLTESQNLKKT